MIGFWIMPQKLFCLVSKRDTLENLIFTKLIIVFTLNLAFPVYEVITFKLIKL